MQISGITYVKRRKGGYPSFTICIHRLGHTCYHSPGLLMFTDITIPYISDC